MHSKLRRLARVKKSVEPYLQRRKEKAAQDRSVLVEVARDHAVTLALLLLHGNPKLNEPLELALERCLTKFPPGRIVAARVNDVWRELPHVVFRAILEELPGKTETQKFQHVFDIAPPWLLKVTCAPITADLLGLKCPDLSRAPREGRNARDQFLCWPDLPQGTLQGGGPVRPFNEEALTEEERRELYMQAVELMDEARQECINEGIMPD